MRASLTTLLALGALGLLGASGCNSSAVQRQPTQSQGGSGGNGGGGDGGGGGALAMCTGSAQGEVRALDGSALGNAVLGLCDEFTCRSLRSEAGGDFLYVDAPCGHYKLDVRADPDMAGTFGALSFPVDIVEDQTTVIDQLLWIPETGTGTVLTGGSQTIAIDAQLSVRIDKDALELPFGMDEAYIAGVRVAPEHHPPNEMPTGTVLAVWALNPYAIVSTEPIAVTVVNDFGLAPMTPVTFHNIEHEWGEVLASASGTVSSDGSQLEASPGEGFNQITWLIVTTP